MEMKSSLVIVPKSTPAILKRLPPLLNPTPDEVELRTGYGYFRDMFHYYETEYYNERAARAEDAATIARLSREIGDQANKQAEELAWEQEARQKEKAEAAAAIEELKRQIVKLTHDKFGVKSEHANQLDQPATRPETEQETEYTGFQVEPGLDLGIDEPERVKPSRRASFPSHYPRVRVVVPPPTNCPCCGGNRLSKMGEDVTESMEVIPRTYKVIQTVREKFTCRDCEAVTQPPAPYHAIPAGFRGSQLAGDACV
jgi:transposase